MPTQYYPKRQQKGLRKTEKKIIKLNKNQESKPGNAQI